jgi:hypothetical protein
MRWRLYRSRRRCRIAGLDDLSRDERMKRTGRRAPEGDALEIGSDQIALPIVWQLLLPGEQQRRRRFSGLETMPVNAVLGAMPITSLRAIRRAGISARLRRIASDFPPSVQQHRRRYVCATRSHAQARSSSLFVCARAAIAEKGNASADC